ncbi:LPXTG cell wall anchor domain-containing protein [Lactiplantibacillus carotarum]|uniref:LPXTG cell wall anchor domain-containing protein n=1 Tax=Lactiplantibacillus carotarum TaxID=2993456 RepID=UPI00298EDA70|nr:LPXTG cell wall anchor domain-containing protein [Lactiplantibacillus carotarum]
MRLDAAKAAVQANQTVLAALQQQLANYQNAPAILAAAQLAYDQADANLATVQTALSQAAAVLAADQRTSGPAQVDATALSSTAGQPENVVHLKHQAQPVRVSLPAVKAAASMDQRLTADQTLPQTDEQAPAAISLLGLAVLGLVGLGYAELRRKFN